MAEPKTGFMDFDSLDLDLGYRDLTNGNSKPKFDGVMGDLLKGMTDSIRKIEEERRTSQAKEIAEWRALAARIKIERPMKIEIEIAEGGFLFYGSGAYLSIIGHAPDRVTGLPVKLFLQPAPLPALKTEMERLQFIRRYVRELYMHELDEQFLLAPEAEAAPLPPPPRQDFSVEVVAEVGTATGHREAAAEPPKFTRPFDPHPPRPLAPPRLPLLPFEMKFEYKE